MGVPTSKTRAEFAALRFAEFTEDLSACRTTCPPIGRTPDERSRSFCDRFHSSFPRAKLTPVRFPSDLGRDEKEI
jgi:hypothetical protein